MLHKDINSHIWSRPTAALIDLQQTLKRSWLFFAVVFSRSSFMAFFVKLQQQPNNTSPPQQTSLKPREILIQYWGYRQANYSHEHDLQVQVVEFVAELEGLKNCTQQILSFPLFLLLVT